MLAGALEPAGFVRRGGAHRAVARRLPSAAECVRFQQESFGALHQMMAGLTPDERADTWREVEAALTRFEGADGFVGPCEMLVGAGTAPG